jgi:hypothetical protein
MPASPPPDEYVLHFGGRTRQIVRLDRGRLTRVVEHGPGKPLDIGVDELTGFTVHRHGFKGTSPHGAVLAASQKLLGFDGQLLVGWRRGGVHHKAAITCHSQAAELHALLDRLAAVAPHADLRGRPIDDARRALGMWTTTQQALLFVGLVFAFLGAVFGLAALGH